MVQSENINDPNWNVNGPDYDQIEIINFCAERGLTRHSSQALLSS